MKKKIVIAVSDFSSEQIRRIGDAVDPWAELVAIPQDSGEEEYVKALRGTEVFIGWPKPEWVRSSSLRLLQIGSSGWDAYQGKGLEENKNFILCSARGIYTTGVAEHAIAMLFALVRRIPVHVHDKDNRRFLRHLPYADEIMGATVCIVGMGAIGSAIATRCMALGMNVHAVVRSVDDRQYPTIDRLFSIGQLKEAVSVADHVVVAVPGIAENVKLFSRDVLLSFKPGACFYNVSRGTVVDEEALYELLEAGLLGGAGLDVVTEEPLRADSKLWGLGDQVLITGHSAGLSSGHTERWCRLTIRNLENYHAGKPLENRMI